MCLRKATKNVGVLFMFLPTWKLSQVMWVLDFYAVETGNEEVARLAWEERLDLMCLALQHEIMKTYKALTRFALLSHKLKVTAIVHPCFFPKLETKIPCELWQSFFRRPKVEVIWSIVANVAPPFSFRSTRVFQNEAL